MLISFSQMASACVNNIGVSPENFPSAAAKYPSYGWLSPRISFSREEDSNTSRHPNASSAKVADPPEIEDPSAVAAVDFEFRLDDPVAMLPADELFSDGKLVPLQISNAKPLSSLSTVTSSMVNGLTEIRSPETAKSSCRRIMDMEISGTDPYLFSPKAPRCSSRWKELLGFKRLYQNSTNPKSDTLKTTSSSSSSSSASSTFLSSTSNPKSSALKHFLHRSSKSCSCNSSSSSSAFLDHTLSLPLLKDSDCESVSISSSRLSLSSSSSSHEHDDLPRLSLDSDKPNQAPNPNPFVLNRNQNPPRMRMVKPKSDSSSGSNNGPGGTRVGRSPVRRSAGETSSGVGSRGVSVDSPRMNSSGKIVFQSLERSSSSPSSFNGGPRFKHRGMERSYSANVRVTPVLNVPVCSLRGSSKSGSVFGFGQLFSSSPQKREGGGAGGVSSGKGGQQGSSRTRIERS